jgi:uncharacterized membrane protein
MAVNPGKIPLVARLDLPRWLLWARLPLQPLLIAVLLVATRRSLPPA